MTELEEFFGELQRQYKLEKQEFVWDWEGVSRTAESRNLPPNVDMLTDYVCFIAFNLAKNVMHGQLPDPLHTRMIFNKSEWVNKYIEFLER